MTADSNIPKTAFRALVVIALAAAVGIVLYAKNTAATKRGEESARTERSAGSESDNAGIPLPQSGAGKRLPKLVDLGSETCIPCKMMAPILDELKATYADRFEVIFIDVWKNPDAARQYGVRVIPTQIFYDAEGKERFRHEGFFSKENILDTWKKLGVDVNPPDAELAFSRLEPDAPDARPAGSICYMCDGDIRPETRVVVRSEKGEVLLCEPHCYFILYSCLTEDKTDFEQKVFVTDAPTANLLPALEAAYLYGADETTGRPTIRAFADRDSAMAERRSQGGNLLTWPALEARELAVRCGFCDRAVYPEDAAIVKAEGLHTWGCCSHCALGVAARTGKDIEVLERDRLTGEAIIVKTLDGSVAFLDPPTATAWFGMRPRPDGSFGSAGCFHQGFFANADNLRRWAEQNPSETGKQISIAQALADKMKMSPEQISKACKIGECAPR